MAETRIMIGGASSASVPEAFDWGSLFWLFLIGCVLGYVIESIYCRIVRGKWVSRKGMVYGPFSQIYGFGAVLLTVVLSPLSKKGAGTLFLGSAVLGGLFEAGSSVFQEKTFGTVSWNYSKEKGSLFGGRTSLRFMLYWGLLGCVYISLIHPVLFSLIGMIPTAIRVGATGGLFFFLCGNLLLSCAALLRWQARRLGTPAANQLDIWLDRRFHDARMARIYPDMKPVENHFAIAEQQVCLTPFV